MTSVFIFIVVASSTNICAHIFFAQSTIGYSTTKPIRCVSYNLSKIIRIMNGGNSRIVDVTLLDRE